MYCVRCSEEEEKYNICVNAAVTMMSIHLLHLSWVGSQCYQGIPDIIIPSDILALHAGSRGFPRPDEMHKPSSDFWIYLRVYPLLVGPLQREAARKHPNQIPKPPQLAPFQRDGAAALLLSDVQAPHSISEPSHPTEGNLFPRLYSRFSFFWSQLR